MLSAWNGISRSLCPARTCSTMCIPMCTCAGVALASIPSDPSRSWELLGSSSSFPVSIAHGTCGLGLVDASFSVVAWVYATNAAVEMTIFGGNDLTKDWSRAGAGCTYDASKPHRTGGVGKIVDKLEVFGQCPDTQNGLRTYVSGSKLVFSFQYVDCVTDARLPSATWTHVAFVYDKSLMTQTVHMDGAQYPCRLPGSSNGVSYHLQGAQPPMLGIMNVALGDSGSPAWRLISSTERVGSGCSTVTASGTPASLAACKLKCDSQSSCNTINFHCVYPSCTKTLLHTPPGCCDVKSCACESSVTCELKACTTCTAGSCSLASNSKGGVYTKIAATWRTGLQQCGAGGTTLVVQLRSPPSQNGGCGSHGKGMVSVHPP